MNKIKRTIFSIILAVVLLSLAACNLFHPPLPPSTAENLPPETHISFFYHPDTTLGPSDYWVNKGDTIWVLDTLVMGLDTTVSVQEVHWWGDDPDGNVIGYYYRWSYMDSAIFTQDESAIFYLPLRTQFDIYSLHVQAMDNDSLVDPSAAVASFPVFNSPPEIEWKLNSFPQSTKTADSIHISFQHHSFFWDISDIDGKETVTDIYYSLDDTSSWQHLPGSERQVLITDITTGYHRIFLKAKDIAGSESNIISFPDENNEDEMIKGWLVEEPIGELLIVNDFASDQGAYEYQNFYENIVQSLVGPNGYSIWEIGRSGTDGKNTANTIPYSPEDIELNLKTFSKVFWFSYYGGNSIEESSLALTRFVAGGGTLFMNNSQVYNIELSDIKPDTTWTFTDLDSVYLITGRMESGDWQASKTVYIDAFWDDTTKNSPLELKVSRTIGKLFGLVPGPSSKIRYQVEPTENNTSNYAGNPVIMIESDIALGKTYYMSLPLYDVSGNNNIDDLFRHVFEINE
jgi:hypothetical protein